MSNYSLNGQQSNTLPIDREQSLALFYRLGYQDGDTIFARSLPGKGCKAQPKNFQFKLPNLPRKQSIDSGLYFVVNGGGHQDEAVRRGRSLFWEWDDRPFEDQLMAWQPFGLEPNIQVSTRKSIHSYIHISDGCSVDEWRLLQADLLEWLDADRTLKNPSRLMRIAGAWHVKDGEDPIRCNIVHQCDRIYTYSELRNLIPTQSHQGHQGANSGMAASTQTSTQQQRITWAQFDRNFKLPAHAIVPLESCLSRDDRSLIESGCATGSRNGKGFKLAVNLIATAEYLESTGQRFDGIPEQLFDRYCRNCPSGEGWNEKEWDAVWRSAQKEKGGTTLSPEAIENCIKQIEWKRVSDGRDRIYTTESAVQPNTSQQQQQQQQPNTLPAPSLRDQICEAMEANLKPSELQEKKALIRVNSRLSMAEFDRLWNAIAEEFTATQEDFDEQNRQIDRLLESKRSTLSAHGIISPMVADAIAQQSKWMNLREESYLSLYLTGIGSMAKNGTVLCANVATNFDVSPNLFTIIVAESSQRKSPVVKTVISRPFKQIQKELKEQWEESHRQWEEDKAIAKKDDEPFHDPEPQRPVLYATKYTGESILAQATRTPDNGLCIVSDEIAGLFKSANQYRSGAGSDKEDLLSFYDGEGGAVLRVAGLRDDVDSLNLGMVGGIQPKVLQKFLGDCDDSNGNWARFAFIQQPNAIAHLPGRNEIKNALDLSAIAADIYRRVHDFKPQTYYFTEVADDFFRKAYHRCEVNRVDESTSLAMRSAWGKLPGRIAKYALCLHLESAAANGEMQPRTFVTAETLKKAIEKAFLDIQQLESLYVDFNEDVSSGQLAKVIELSLKNGEVKAKDIQMRLSTHQRSNINPDTIRQWFVQLAEQGWGETKNSGIRLTFTAFKNGKKQKVGSVATVFATAETIDIKEIDRKVGSVAKVGDFAENTFEVATETPPPDRSDQLTSEGSDEDEMNALIEKTGKQPTFATEPTIDRNRTAESDSNSWLGCNRRANFPEKGENEHPIATHPTNGHDKNYADSSEPNPKWTWEPT